MPPLRFTVEEAVVYLAQQRDDLGSEHAGVIHSGNLVLATELPAAAHPALETAGTGDNEGWERQTHAL